jgi:hypothetical protein
MGDLLILISYQKKSKCQWLYINGEVTEECRVILAPIKYLRSIDQARDSGLLIEVTGTASKERFLKDLGPYKELEAFRRYTKVTMFDGSENHIWDKTEPNIVVVFSFINLFRTIVVFRAHAPCRERSITIPSNPSPLSALKVV